MVRSGGRAQASELCLEARFLEERFPASRRTEPNSRARSMRRVWSASEAVESRSLSKETSMQREGESVRPKRVPSRWSMSSWLRFGNLGFCEGQGRLAMDDGVWMWWRRVSIAGGYQRDRERESVLCFSLTLRYRQEVLCHVFLGVGACSFMKLWGLAGSCGTVSNYTTALLFMTFFLFSFFR